MIRIALLACLALIACGREAVPAKSDTAAAAASVSNAGLELSCAAFEGQTYDTLVQRFGAENIVNQSLPGPEGEDYPATLIYPDDSARRLEVHWQDVSARERISEVSVSGETSAWRAPHGLALGQTMDEVERLNGRAFQLYGFGWDYGGNVSDWLGGAFAPQQGCIVRAQFHAQTDDVSVMGDRPFNSDLPAMRAARPSVNQIGLGFRRPS